MFRSHAQMIGAAVFAGAVLLLASRFAPEPVAIANLPSDSLARAVATENPHLLELCVAQQCDPNTPDAEGQTALLIATQKHDGALIARLLELGANVDVADGGGRTPLMLAAADGNVELLQTFLERSSHAGAVDSSGRSAAHHAILASKPEALDLVLSALPEIDVPSLLAAACDTADAGMIRMVLERTPSPLPWTRQTRGALRTALSAHENDFVRLILSRHAGPPTVEEGTTPLLAQAIVVGDTELFKALLAAGVDANTVVPAPADKSFVSLIKSEDLRSYVRGDDGVTVLMIASGLGKTEYIRALLDAGADRNRQTSKYKMLALYFAARTDKPKNVQMLLGRGPTPDQLRVEISLATQRASVIKDGVPILQTSVSTGRKGFDTPAGQYVITDKNRSHRSSIYNVEMPFFMRLNCRDFGLHAGAVPRYPASHGCIRLPADIAQRLFTEIPVGTVVTIN